jgi:hypothetical protein
MATIYPSYIDTGITLPKAIDLVTPVRAESVNILRDTIIAIENELGIDPSGTYGTVRARLDALTLLVAGGTGQGVQEVKQNGITIVAPANSLNFTGSCIVTDSGDCEAKIEILTNPGTITGAVNIGSGADIFSADVANILQFRGISGTNNITTVVNGNNIEVSGALLLPLDGTSSMTGDLNLGGNDITNVGTVDGIDVTDHHTRHENSGADEISVTGLSGDLADPQKVSIKVSSGAIVGSRKVLNLIPSANLSITATDDVINGEIDINIDTTTVASATDMYQEIFSTTPGQTNFVLAHTPVSQQHVEMFINGVSQTVGYDYTLSGTTVTYIGTVVLEGGEEVVCKYFRSITITDGYDLQLVYDPINYDPPVNEVIGEHIARIDEALGVVDYILYDHAPRHEYGGADELDGYEIALDYNPVNYTPPVNNIIGEHIAAIDEALSASGGNLIVESSGTPVGTQPALNFIPGANIGLTIADNTTGSRVDVTIAATVASAPSVAISAGSFSRDSGTVVFNSTSNGVSVGMNSLGMITFSTSQTPVWFSAGTNSRSSGTVQFASASQNVSVGMDTDGLVTFSINSAASQVPLWISAGTNSRSVGTIQFASASQNVSAGMDTDGLITLSVVSVASQVPLWISAGANSTSAGTVTFSNSNNVSFGMDTNGAITGSVLSPMVISAGTNSLNSGTVVFSNSNGVSFGMGTDGVITGSVSVVGGGVTVSNSATSFAAGNIVFSDNPGASWGITSGTDGGTLAVDCIETGIVGGNFGTTNDLNDTYEVYTSMSGVHFNINDPIKVTNECVGFNFYSIYNPITLYYGISTSTIGNSITITDSTTLRSSAELKHVVGLFSKTGSLYSLMSSSEHTIQAIADISISRMYSRRLNTNPSIYGYIGSFSMNTYCFFENNSYYISAGTFTTTVAQSTLLNWSSASTACSITTVFGYLGVTSSNTTGRTLNLGMSINSLILSQNEYIWAGMNTEHSSGLTGDTIYIKASTNTQMHLFAQFASAGIGSNFLSFNNNNKVTYSRLSTSGTDTTTVVSGPMVDLYQLNYYNLLVTTSAFPSTISYDISSVGSLGTVPKFYIY